MRIVRVTVPVAGGAGVATGSGIANINGAIYAVRLDLTSQPGTADVTIAEGTTEILSRANSGADETYYPRVTAAKADGTASALTEVAPAVEKATITVAQGDAHASGVKAIFWVE